MTILGTNRICGNGDWETLSVPSLFSAKRKRNRKESAETSINSYCQGQAPLKKNIICPNEHLVSDYWSDVWLSSSTTWKGLWL